MASASVTHLFIGTPTCLNVRTRGMYSRVAADAGLPYANLTALAHASHEGADELWVGTERGVAIWSSSPSGGSHWRYLFGPRWLVGERVRSLAVVKESVAVVTEGGVSWLRHEEWTLSRKASHYQSILTARHDRHGLTAECELVSFGAPEAGCVSTDNDNNGLWTSLVVAAQYMRYRVTGEEEALQSGSRFFGGLVLLHRVTGKRGMVARSACDPQEKGKTCAANGTWIHDKTRWLNSTARGFEGWVWKSDTSSDETTGHVFALQLVARLSPNASERALATSLLVDLVGGICTHGYRLIDVDGQPTTWGRWDPAEVNGQRRLSDERGLQSLQALAYIAAAANVTAAADPQQALWWASLAELTNTTNQYLSNLRNLKITWPTDDNYSDDLLAHLSLYALLTSCPAPSECATRLQRTALLDALRHVGGLLRLERSAMWNAVELALDAPAGRVRGDLAIDGLIWNLRTWPLELIEWPVNNSHRIDLVYERTPDRFHRVGNQIAHTRPPLPANERRQDRWNKNPFDVSDGWTGMVEGDPGAWLLPYWMARFHGILTGAD